jgi:hypothetical protein
MGGASCTGKTTLTARLLDGEHPELADMLGIDRGVAYHVLHGRDWDSVEAPGRTHVLLQYDVTADTPFAIKGEVRPAALEALKRAARVTILTVWEQPDELKRRLKLRYDERGGVGTSFAKQLRKGRLRQALHAMRRLRQRRRLFTEPEGLWKLYRRWFKSCERVPHAQHWLLRSTKPDAVAPFPQFVPDAPFWDNAQGSSPDR